MAKLADLIWKNAGLLRGTFKENEYRKVILPFTILRRLDCVLAPSREKVLAKYAKIKGGGYDLDKMLLPTSGYPYCPRFRGDSLAPRTSCGHNRRRCPRPYRRTHR